MFFVKCLATFVGLLAIVVFSAAAAEPVRPAGRPNIIVILADDMGFSDVGCYGGEIVTPNIDRLAIGGLRFTQFYNNAKCEPSRSSIFSGNFPQWRDRNECISWGSAMRAAGYRIYRTGKVHETGGAFDRSCTMGACGSYWDLRAKTDDKPPGPLKIDGKDATEYLTGCKDFYTTDVFTDFAVKYLDQDKSDPRPFLLYVAYNAPHYPLHAWPEDIARYRGKYKVGWDEIRRRRFAKQLEIGIFPKDMKMSPRDSSVPDWDSLSEKEKDYEDLRMAVYAAMIDRMDRNIGRLLAKVKEIGQEQNTVVMFLSDNGGCSQDHGKQTDEPGPRGTWHYVGRRWANASNTPFCKYKTYDQEGGISTPLIVSWPGHTKPASFDRQWGNIMDIPVTCLDLAGRKPDRVAGKSLAPAYFGKPRELHDWLCWAILKGKAARQGDWKLVRHGDEPWRLYNIAADRIEQDDLSAKYPEKVKALTSLWEDWDKKCRWIGQP